MPATLSSTVPTASVLPPPNKKFTIAGNFAPFGSHKNVNGAGASTSSSAAASPSARSSIRNLFGESSGPSTAMIPPGVGRSRDDSHIEPIRAPNTVATTYPSRTKAEDGPWSVSVAEAKEEEQPKQPPSQSQSRIGRRTTRKKHGAKADAVTRPAYVLYVTNPTHNLTLHRSLYDIHDLQQSLQDAGLGSLPSFPALERAPAQTTSSRKILQTISRTLSPGANRSRVALSQITSSLILQQGGDANPTLSSIPASTTTTPYKSSSRTPLRTPKNADASTALMPSMAPAPLTPSSPAEEVSSAQTTTAMLANYFTSLANRSDVKTHKAWRRFIRVRTEDLESVRVERRIHRVRSDLASHIKSSVAPTNTNVGAGPSQSDIGEDGGRTEDEGASAAATATPSERPEVPARSTSVDACAGVGSKKGSPNFDNIPEEPTEPVDDVGGVDANASVETGAGADESVTQAETSLSMRTDGAVTPASTAPATPAVAQRKRRTRREPEKVTVDDFEMIRVLGKGCAGKVLLVRHRPTEGLFAMKSIHKRHVLAHQELQHTLTEQAVLKRMARKVMDPFVVKLWWSFHDRSNLYLVMDFHPGGDLATQLSRWGRLGRDRARFYAAEIVEGVEGLHKAGVIYRDLKPENVLIGADGHIVLSDFGLSKEFSHRRDADATSSTEGTPRRGPHWMSASDDSATHGDTPRRRAQWNDERDTTTTFCGTAEYLAPEVIQGSTYSYEVDWWSFGTMLYEMLVGITPFWADTHSDMYVRVLHDELVFPDERVFDTDTKSILRGLLQRNPMLRMKEPRIKRHPYFSMIEWAHVFHKRYIPPYIPPIDPSNEMDTQNFDEAFLDMQPVVHGDDGDDEQDCEPQNGAADAESTTVSVTVTTRAAPAPSLFDGYSFRGRKDSGSIRSVADSDSLDVEQPGSDDWDSTTKREEHDLREEHEVVVSAAPAPAMEPTTTTTTTTPAPAPAPTKKTTTSTTTTTTPKIIATAPEAAQNARPSAKPVRVPTPEEDSEDDETAARNALLALAALEREASGESSTATAATISTTASTDPTSIGDTSSSDNAPVRAKAKTRRKGGRTASTRDTIVETDGENADGEDGGGDTSSSDDDDDDGDTDDDDDWDLIDVPTGGHASEINGSRGQNLFARGVVDTYRLLRRQDSTRLTPSTSVNSGSTRPFSRLRQRKAASANLCRPSRGDLTSGSAASIESGNTGSASPVASKSVGTLGDVGEGADDGARVSTSTPSASTNIPAGSKSLSSSRIKRRFTTFFEHTTAASK